MTDPYPASVEWRSGGVLGQRAGRGPWVAEAACQGTWREVAASTQETGDRGRRAWGTVARRWAGISDLQWLYSSAGRTPLRLGPLSKRGSSLRLHLRCEKNSPIFLFLL